MAKVCVRDCFIVDYKSFKQGEIVNEKEDLEKIGDSDNFRDYEEEKPKKKKEGGEK